MSDIISYLGTSFRHLDYLVLLDMAKFTVQNMV